MLLFHALLDGQLLFGSLSFSVLVFMIWNNFLSFSLLSVRLFHFVDGILLKSTDKQPSNRVETNKFMCIHIYLHFCSFVCTIGQRHRPKRFKIEWMNNLLCEEKENVRHWGQIKYIHTYLIKSKSMHWNSNTFDLWLHLEFGRFTDKLPLTRSQGRSLNSWLRVGWWCRWCWWGGERGTWHKNGSQWILVR